MTLSNFKDWTKVTYVNSSTPHITAHRLNKNEDAIDITMNELNSYNSTCLKDFIDYSMNNSVKEIHNFENTSDFTTTGSMVLGNMYDDAIFGINALKIQDLNNSGGSIGIYDTFSTKDLTVFPSGASSSSSDYIMFAFYVSDATKVRNILIRLGDDDTNCYYKFVPSWHSTWNIKKFKKSDFGTDGTPTGWDDITFLRIYVETHANASSDYVACNKIWLTRKESNGLTASSLYVTDGAGTYDSYMYLQGMDDVVSYYDKRVCKKGIHNAVDDYSDDMIQIMSDVNAFSFKCEMYSKIDSFAGASLLWYIDSYNYINIAPQGDESNVLNIMECVNGSLSIIAVSPELDAYISNGDRMEFWVEKTSDNIVRARLEVDGMTPVYVEAVSSLSSTASGDLGIITCFWGTMYFITDFVANSNPSIPLSAFSNNLQKIALKYWDEPSLTTTLADVTDLFMKLSSNSLFEVELILVYSSNGQPGLKLAWNVSGDYEVINNGRVFIAAGDDTVDFTDIDLYMKNEALDTALELGILSGGEMPYYEKILIKTGNSGCKLQLQWAQYNTSGSYIQIDKGSYIRATKL